MGPWGRKTDFVVKPQDKTRRAVDDLNSRLTQGATQIWSSGSECHLLIAALRTPLGNIGHISHIHQTSENALRLGWHDLPVRQIPTGTSLTLGEAWTIAFTYFTVAITVSLVHSTAGTPPWIIVAATLLVNSATATLAYAAVTAAGGSATAGVVAGCLTATRFGVLAAALAPRLWPERWKRAVAAFAAFDPNIALANREQKDTDVRRVYVAMSLWLVLPWWLGASLGVAIGDWVSNPKALGMDAMFPALFIAIIRPQLTTNNARLIAILGAGIALALVEVLQGGLPFLVAALPALLALRNRNGERA
ncbi:MAG: hypothetical protein CL407_05940 [Acidimicrobiaceae bacterium]|nr:hypothetical protein [Acidimicrobiaceae bacterium]